MRRLIFSLLTLVIALSVQAFDPKDLIGGLINKATSSTKFTVDDLKGTWLYDSPAVSFESDNVLKNIGGAGAAAAVETKLAPYYQKLGFTKTTLTVSEDHSFSLKLGLLILKGTVEKDESGEGLVFSFNAIGNKTLGKVKANASKSADTLNLTFDATRLIQVLTTISSKLNIKSLNTLSTLLNSYEGIYIGFKMKSK
ncbi:MAG: DUF4923 family protein [Muribaculaceae bacterium]|nr:DUF4923 family protein [Muribaculaceae bacterium]